MGFFDKLKQMVGVTGIKVNLVLPQSRYKQGDTISGVVKVTGGPEAKVANKLTVALVEAYPEITIQTTQVPAEVPAQPESPEADESQPRPPRREIKTESLTSRHVVCEEVILAQQFQVPAQAAMEYAVALQLPAQAAISGPCQEWHLKTELDISGAFDAADTDRITVTLDESAREVHETICRAAGFPANCVLRIEAVDPSGERLSKRVYYL